MAVEEAAPAPAKPPPPRPLPGSRATLLFDWAVALLSVWLVGGVFIDGWAHNHLQSLETFFTPWHAVLYSGFAAVSTPIAAAWLLGVRRGRPFLAAVPAGYELSALGVVLFGIGGLLDMLWHLAFGIEVSTDALLSPTHLLLVSSGILIISGPLRAGWRRHQATSGWRTAGPAIVAATLVLAAFGFFTQFAHPFVQALASPEQHSTWGAASVYVMDVDGTLQTRLTASGAWDPAWSPDGGTIAFHSTAHGASQIWTMRADGGGKVQVTSGAGDHWGPAWSPDGEWLAYAGGPSAAFQIWLVRPDGSGAHAIVTDTRTSLEPDWAPDGKRLVFATSTGNGWRLETVAADGSDRVTLPLAGTEPSFSPDGNLLAYTSSGAGPAQVWVARADGTGAHQVTHGRAASSSPAWSPDGTRLAFVSELGGGQHVLTARPDGSELQDLTQGTGTWATGRPVWSPGGTRLAYSAGGYPAVSPDLGQALGVASILLQAALLSGVLLLLLGRWRVPVGTATLVIAAPIAMVAFMRDTYEWVPVAVGVGIAADAAIRWLRPGRDRPWSLRLVAFAIPAALYFAYFATLAVREGIAWSVHLWAGSAVMAGLVGLLLSLLVVEPRRHLG